MKKIFCMAVSLLMLFVFTACGSSAGTSGSDKPAAEKKAVSAAPASAAPAEKQDGGSRILVVYFSCTGNTKALAEHAAQALHADLFAIQPEEPYTSSDLNYNDESTRATVEQKDAGVRPKIKNSVENMAKYDKFVLAYPIWWGQAPRIMDTFVESYDFSGKTMTAICTSGGSELGSSDAALAELAGKSAKWKEGRQFTAGTSAEELGKWFKQIGLLE